MIVYRDLMTLEEYEGETFAEKLQSFIDIVFSEKTFLSELKRDTRRLLAATKRNGRHVYSGKRRKQFKFESKKVMRNLID